MSDQVLHLVVPGLLGPLPLRGGTTPWQDAARPVHLERLLARATRSVVPADSDALLFHLFGLDMPSGTDLPSAPFSYLADAGQSPDGVVYHATPVYLRPDQDRLLLFDAPTQDLTTEEAAAFLQAFNEHFRDDGWRLSAPLPGHWYLQCEVMPGVRTHALGAVLGRNVDLFLPEGPDARTWLQRLNEVQMLFHGLPVNQQRVEAGRLPVSGLWLHGGGVLPSTIPRGLQVDGEATPLLQGLAGLARGRNGGRLRWLGGAQRALWDADPSAWWHAVQSLDTFLAGYTGPVRLYPGDGHAYRWQGFERFRLWRRRRPLKHWLLDPSADYA